MASYLMFGTLMRAARKTVSAKRTADAMALIKKHGCEFKTGYALLGEVGFVVVLELPGIERTIKLSVGLCRLFDINFRTAPAVGTDEFDKLAAT